MSQEPHQTAFRKSLWKVQTRSHRSNRVARLTTAIRFGYCQMGSNRRTLERFFIFHSHVVSTGPTQVLVMSPPSHFPKIYLATISTSSESSIIRLHNSRIVTSPM